MMDSLIGISELGGSSGDDVRGSRDVALNILRPSVRLLLEYYEVCTEDQELLLRLKGVEDVIQTLVDPPEFNSEILNKIARGILEILEVVDFDFSSIFVFVHSRKQLRSPENVVRFFDSAIHTLRFMEDFTMKNEISDALDELRLLRNFLWVAGNWTIEHDKVAGESCISVQEIPAVLSFLILSHFGPLAGDKQQVRKFSSDFKLGLQKVRQNVRSHVEYLYGRYTTFQDDIDTSSRIIDPEFSELLDRLISRVGKQQILASHQMQAAIDELVFLKCNLLEVLQLYSQEDSAVVDMEFLFSATLSLIIETAFQVLFSGFRPLELIEGLDSIKREASRWLFSTNTNFSLPSLSASSSTNPLESLNGIIEKLEKPFECEASQIAPLKCELETYYQEMVSVRDFFTSLFAKDQTANSQMVMLMAPFQELDYQYSLIVDSFLAGKGPLWYHKLGMFVVVDEIKLALRSTEAVLEKTKASDINICSISSSLDCTTSLNNSSPHNKLVGVSDASYEIIGLLIRGAIDLRIVSIVGMPGLGKTTLANYVYEHPCINLHFHVLAWCCVSQCYDGEALLAGVLSQVVDVETKTSLEEVRGGDVAEILYRKLKGRRYLIVFDDIWDIEVWQDLERTFPNDENGSRVIFTTRHQDVARKAYSLIHNLRFLCNEESFELLLLKVFDTKTCPPELTTISRRIANDCKGLPLAVVLIAGILRRIARSKESWEQVAAIVKSLPCKHGNQLDNMQVTDILELSYTRLPVALRPCFLYFAAFPPDTSISVSKLMQLWISEGYVQEENLRHMSLEEEAHSYLDELIDRSLVMIAKRSSNGGVKACHIHDILREFCAEKFKKTENHMFGGIMISHLHSIMYYNIKTEALQSGSRPHGPVFVGRIHSLKRADPASSEPITSMYKHLTLRKRFLKVLDLGKVRVDSSADTSDIVLIASALVHLRFLGIRPREMEIPAKIGNLRNLETLALTGVIGCIKLPESLWKLSRLRNVLMDHGFFYFPRFTMDFLTNPSQLYNLRSVSTLLLQYGDDDDEDCLMMRMMAPHMQKLACRFVYSWDEAKCCCVFPVLDFLYQLESLKLSFSGMVRYPCKFNFPSNLKKLSLSNSRLPWDQISVIAKQLPNLQVLKLLFLAFKGPRWEMGDGANAVSFPKLRFLKLDFLDIEVWSAEEEPFPCLEQLVVLSCPRLQEIPSCFGEIPTLVSIEMKWCSSSAMDSIKQILQDQRELSNYDLKITLIGASLCKQSSGIV